MDILGPFPRAVGGYRFLYVAIDKFTKWPEVTPVVNITKKSAVAFLKSIVCRFGIQTTSSRTTGPNSKANSSKSTARTSASSYALRPWHIPVAMDRLRERMQRSSGGLKTRTINCLKKHGAKWVDELPCVLWGNRTTTSRATGETPSFQVYGAEACLPPEIHLGSPRVQAFEDRKSTRLNSSH